MNNGSGKKLSSPAVCERYGIHRRTFGYWMTNASLAFPKPITINSKHYFDLAEIEAWERSRAACSEKKAA